MDWVCIHDRQPLVEDENGLSCTHCGRAAPVEDGIPIFDPQNQDPDANAAPLIVELWQEMQRSSPTAAAEKFCASHDCTRAPNNADWKFFFGVPDGGRIVEIGAGFGDDTVDLANRAGETVALTPTLANARIVRERLGHESCGPVTIAAVPDLTRLPLADGSVAAIAMEDLGASGFGVGGATLLAIAAEWRRVLAPGGIVFVGLPNALDRWLGLGFLRRRLQAKPAPMSLNRAVKRAGDPAPAIGLGRLARAMADAGFTSRVVYAPLPSENKTEIVIPVEDHRVIRYFLNNLIRKNSLLMRLAVRLASAAVALNLVRHVVPYYFLTFTRGDAATSD